MHQQDILILTFTKLYFYNLSIYTPRDCVLSRWQIPIRVNLQTLLQEEQKRGVQRIEQQPREEEEPRPVNRTTWTAREKKPQMVPLLRRFVCFFVCDYGLHVNLLSDYCY